MAENERPRRILHELSEAVRQYNDALVQNSPVAERDRLRGHVFTQVTQLIEDAFSVAHFGALNMWTTVRNDPYMKQVESLLRRMGTNDLNNRERDQLERERNQINGDVASRVNASITTLLRQLEQFDRQVSQAKDDRPDRKVQTIDDLVEGKVRRGVRTLAEHLVRAVGLATALNGMIETMVGLDGSSQAPRVMDSDSTPLLTIRSQRFVTHSGKAAFLARVTGQYCAILHSELANIEQTIRNAKLHGAYDAVALQAAIDGFVRTLQAALRSCALLDELTLAPVGIWSKLFGAPARKEPDNAFSAKTTGEAHAAAQPDGEAPREASGSDAEGSGSEQASGDTSSGAPPSSDTSSRNDGETSRVASSTPPSTEA